jgi:hypothetical protein
VTRTAYRDGSGEPLQGVDDFLRVGRRDDGADGDRIELRDIVDHEWRRVTFDRLPDDRNEQ